MYILEQMDLLTLLVTIQIIIFIIIAIIAFIYACLILFIRRFRHTNNIFIANICLSIIISSAYFIMYFQGITIYDSPSLCNLFFFGFNIASIDIPFSFLAFTVHRFYSVIYHRKDLFKKKRWIVICIVGHWIIQCIIFLPFINGLDQYCNMQVWMGFYTFTTAVIIPLLINAILNIKIFLYVRRSSRRIQPQAVSTVMTSTNNQQARINRRNLSLLKHMIFTFLIFVIGWAPIFITNIIDIIIPGHLIAILSCTYVSAICTFGIIIYLFICNHDIRKFLFNKIRQCFQH